MAAAYDTYDYPSYWLGREYEHESEVLALASFLEQIPKIGTILEIGAGFGRLAPNYIFRAKKIILSDPSAKLLKVAAQKFKAYKNIKIIQSGFSHLTKKIRPGSCDLIVMVRVLHHIEQLDEVFQVVNRLLRKDGYFILEFANKRHLKATLSEFMHGNITFTGDIFPRDIRSKKSKKLNTLPFINYHPDIVKNKLEDHGFKIVALRSVSNIRSTRIKKILSLTTLVSIEKYLQGPLSHFNFGPSIFILAQKSS